MWWKVMFITTSSKVLYRFSLMQRKRPLSGLDQRNIPFHYSWSVQVVRMGDDVKSYFNLVYIYNWNYHFRALCKYYDWEWWRGLFELCYLLARPQSSLSNLPPPSTTTTLTNNFYRYISITVTHIVLRCFLMLVGQYSCIYANSS